MARSERLARSLVALALVVAGCSSADAEPASADPPAADGSPHGPDAAGVTPDAGATPGADAALDATPLDATTADAIASDASTSDAGAADAPPANVSTGWEMTVYYTVVESLHGGAFVDVTGCPDVTCQVDDAYLGAYPSDFVAKVTEEGTGRITSGPQAGRYLDWASDTGFWLDDAPRNAQGGALVPWVSAAADPSIAFGTRFTLVDCGVDDQNGAPIDPAVCAALRAGAWQVHDRFTVGTVGKHVDLYIGEEYLPDFDATENIVSDRDAVLSFP